MTEQQFDVFLCHNSEDKPAVIEIAQQLRQNDLSPWLDVWELQPGAIWQFSLEQQIENIKAAAVFVGQQGLGPWQSEEIYAFLQEFISRKCPVIPVMLPNAPQQPKLPIFLRNRHWVDFRMQEPPPLVQLVWGITGIRPLVPLNTAQAINTQTAANLDAVVWASPTTIDIGKPPEPKDDLSSEKGIDYRKLRDLLKAGKWREADRETYEVMMRAVGKKSGTWFTQKELFELPCVDLLTIDRLWVKYSNNKFGFSIQKNIWQQCGRPQSSGQSWNLFCVQVGWQDANKVHYLEHQETRASFDKAPLGEFPRLGRGWWGVVGVTGVSSIALRLESCGQRHQAS
ncbi:GUN4 domain-containing protein [Nodosilinea sp. PGN35]|uniref:GUN4 domain-containing protein n=1 Tax=Nodosilinea sp. PGN35 TaxID=3020489 RepID=UPI0023B22563|nr:GUN4 domain-containing protein [Nodosilinea sp. TSF1-S3]MDF0367918.1 GUN4 domain-containing protein [Nodosilinea sp. TSF1-S3]